MISPGRAGPQLQLYRGLRGRALLGHDLAALARAPHRYRRAMAAPLRTHHSLFLVVSGAAYPAFARGDPAPTRPVSPWQRGGPLPERPRRGEEASSAGFYLASSFASGWVSWRHAC